MSGNNRFEVLASCSSTDYDSHSLDPVGVAFDGTMDIIPEPPEPDPWLGAAAGLALVALRDGTVSVSSGASVPGDVVIARNASGRFEDTTVDGDTARRTRPS